MSGKRVFLIAVLFFIIVPYLVYAQSLDIKKDILAKIDLPLYEAMGQPENYTISLQYRLDDDCVECIASFFKDELTKRGWEVEEEKVVEGYMDAFYNIKKQIAKASGENKKLMNVDENTAKYILSADENEIRKKVQAYAPIALKAKSRLGNLNCQISISRGPDKKTAVVLNIY